MTRSQTILAQAAVAELLRAACKEEGDTWNLQEKLYAAAETQVAASEAAAPLLRICASCPVLGACREWVTADKYTGIAAEAAWVNGRAAEPGHAPGLGVVAAESAA